MKLTEKQHTILNTIKVIRDKQVRELQKRFPDNPPSEYVFISRLQSAFGITQKQVEQLQKKRVVDIKQSGGFGPMVKPL